jgi:MraZ protein
VQMLSGQFEHTIDAKGRLILPKPFRERFEGKGFLAPNALSCLNLWTESEWTRRVTQEESTLEQASADRLRTFRFVMSLTSFVTIDEQGRFLVPARIRDFAAIESDVLINGVVSHLEIWSPHVWATAMESADQQFRSVD